MRRARAADRLLDTIVVVLVAGALGLAATSPLASQDTAWGEVKIVESPSRTPCVATEASLRQACLATAAAIALAR